jgi:hypothetical protein
MDIESIHITLTKSKEEVFNELADLNNLYNIMPQDKIENWQSDTDSCSFSIKGLASIGMKVKNRSEFELIEIVSEGKNPFPFTLSIHILEKIDSTETYFTFVAEVNSFIKMMAEKPLTNFFNMLAENFKAKHTQV